MVLLQAVVQKKQDTPNFRPHWHRGVASAAALSTSRQRAVRRASPIQQITPDRIDLPRFIRPKRAGPAPPDRIMIRTNRSDVFAAWAECTTSPHRLLS